MISRRMLLGAPAAVVMAATIEKAGAMPNAKHPDYPELFPPYIPTGKPPRVRYWKEGPVLDQYGKDACEAFALVGAYMAATDVRLTTKQGNVLARRIYGQRPDRGDYGISGIDARRIAQEWGMLKSWAMPQTVDELIDALCYRGPVSFGIKTNRRMQMPRDRLIIPPVDKGRYFDHSVVATAYVHKDKISGRGPSVRIRNSWGKTWGRNGSAWITVEDLKKHIGPRPHIGYYEDMWVGDWINPGK